MLVLASTSPRRRQLLSKYFDGFICTSPQFDEENFMCEDVFEYVSTLSKMKAESVKETYPDDIIIACDTIVALKNEILGKPKSYEDAFNTIKKLSGNKHFVLSSYTIMFKDFKITETVKTDVYFNHLSDEQIKNWLNKNTYMDKAGAYAIQEDEFGFVNKIEGSYTNVVGFPIEEILKNLAELNYFPNKEL